MNYELDDYEVIDDHCWERTVTNAVKDRLVSAGMEDVCNVNIRFIDREHQFNAWANGSFYQRLIRY